MSDKKVIAITGASRGLGAEIASYFREQGWHVATCARSQADVDGFHTCCDVTDEKAVQNWLQDVVTKYGRIDTVVHNAGVVAEEDDDWHKVVDINLNAAWYVGRHAYPFLKKQGGRLIYISSVLGLMGVADQPAYCAAKHGLLGLTKSLALRWGAEGITVNAICPGWIETPMFEQRMQQLDLGLKDVEATLPTNRIIQPREISEFIGFLTSAAACSMTGLALPMDSGVLAGPF